MEVTVLSVSIGKTENVQTNISVSGTTEAAKYQFPQTDIAVTFSQLQKRMHER